MNLKQNPIILAALIMAAIFFAFAAEAWKIPSLPTQGGQPVIVNFGCIDIATPTVELDAITAKDLSDYLPAQCTGFEMRVTYGEVVLSHGNMIATGSFQQRIGRLIASGSTFLWRDIGGGPFVGKFMANSGTASVTFDLAW